MRSPDPFSEISGFQWDAGNADKNWRKHGVTQAEAEQAFFNQPLVLPDEDHSSREERYYLLGKTNTERLLFVAFTIRGTLARVISARTMTRKERQAYEQAIAEAAEEGAPEI